MRVTVSACFSVLLVLAAGFVVAQQGTGSNQQAEQPGRLPTLDVEFAAISRAANDEQAKKQEAEQRAAAKAKEYQAQLAELNRQRQADESQAQYRAWQRRQEQAVSQLQRETQTLQGQAGMAAMRSQEATERRERFLNNHPSYTPPATPPAAQPSGTAPPAPSISRIQLPDLNGVEAYQRAVQARDFGASGGRVFDTSRSTSGAPPVVVTPGPGRPNDPLPLRPAPPPARPVIENKSREQRIIPSPGGVIIASTAEIPGVKPADVAAASFDATTSILTLVLRSGKRITCTLDADDFTVAVRSVFDRKVDPSLSMSYDDAKPGFFAVDYTGPLFKTRFGKHMFEIDAILGSIIFNEEGDHRAPASAVIPTSLVFEAHNTRMVGSRVFLLAGPAHFVIENDRLVCRRVESKVQVTATGYAADYHQESLHRLARVMDENFDALVEKFTEFKEFRRLAECVAIAKWLKRHSIAFEWEALKTRTLAEHDFPAYVPAVSWNRLFNGRNLDGWRLNLSSGQFESALKDSHLTLKPTGQQALQIQSSTWGKGYDLRYVVETDGPVEFILRGGTGPGAASVAIDTKGKRHAIELFLREANWSAIGPGIEKTGDLTIPETKKGEPRPTTDFGLRVPPGSKLTLYAAAMRRW
jgi:hypothetical protein